MSASLIVQLVLGMGGQLPEIVKVAEELRASGEADLSSDQVKRVQAAFTSMQSLMKPIGA
jgi:hypothetical protein